VLEHECIRGCQAMRKKPFPYSLSFATFIMNICLCNKQNYKAQKISAINIDWLTAKVYFLIFFDCLARSKTWQRRWILDATSTNNLREKLYSHELDNFFVKFIKLNWAPFFFSVKLMFIFSTQKRLEKLLKICFVMNSSRMRKEERLA
jgi:hypothetical protein